VVALGPVDQPPARLVLAELAVEEGVVVRLTTRRCLSWVRCGVYPGASCRGFFSKRRSRPISFTGAQGVPKYMIWVYGTTGHIRSTLGVCV
jgi:hypothetical protein